MHNFWNQKRKRTFKKKIIKNKIIRNIKPLFEQQEENYFELKRVSNFWNDNYIEYNSNDEKIETYHLMNILVIPNLTWGI